MATNVKVIATTNWAGFGLVKDDFTDVSAEWTQPEVECTPDDESHVSFWVGLDGVTSHMVEQVGTAAACLSANDGEARHYAWIEMYPKAMVPILTVQVRPGDHFKASVHATTAEIYKLRIENTTTGQWFERSLQRAGEWPTSAEWVAEATTICRATCETATLAHFGDVTFSSLSAGTTDGAITLANNSSLVRFDLRSPKVRLAKMSPLALDAPSFDVSWVGAPSRATPRPTASPTN